MRLCRYSKKQTTYSPFLFSHFHFFTLPWSTTYFILNCLFVFICLNACNLLAFVGNVSAFFFPVCWFKLCNFSEMHILTFKLITEISTFLLLRVLCITFSCLFFFLLSFLCCVCFYFLFIFYTVSLFLYYLCMLFNYLVIHKVKIYKRNGWRKGILRNMKLDICGNIFLWFSRTFRSFLRFRYLFTKVFEEM